VTNRELISEAAKAIGIELDWGIPAKSSTPWMITGEGEDRGPSCPWNPIEDDGDALRLAISLDMSITPNKPEQSTTVSCSGMQRRVFWSGGEMIATRLAIVRLAAEVAQQKGFSL
jgi:hypothetical protein